MALTCHRTMGRKVSPRDVEEGARYKLHWSPYNWARKQDGYSSPLTVTVINVTGTRKSGHMQDNTLRIKDGPLAGGQLTHGVDNGYLTGRTQNPDTPDVTDVGRFRKYEKAVEPAAKQRRQATRGGARYGNVGSKQGTDPEFDIGGGL